MFTYAFNNNNSQANTQKEDASRKYVGSTGHVNQNYMTDNGECKVDDHMFCNNNNRLNNLLLY